MRMGFDFLLSRGISIFRRMPQLPVVTVTATGSSASDFAAAPISGIIHGLGADATKGIGLPTPQGVGDWCIVKNSTAANAVLKVYPPAGQKINDGSADAALSMAAKTSAVFVSIDGLGWWSLPLLPS